MLSLSLLSPSYTPPPATIAPPSTDQPSLSSTIPPSSILFTSRRPALITYSSRLVSLPARLLALPFYLLGLRRESEILSIPMAESATFQRGYKNLPSRLLLELQASSELQVYDVRVHFMARFAGLRWLMYNHRIIAFAIFTSAFWISEVAFAALGWFALRSYLPAKEEEGEGIKGDDERETLKEEDDEELDLSDVPRTSSGYERQALQRRGQTVKDEDTEGTALSETAIPPTTAEPDEDDVEDDEKSGVIGSTGGWGDSAIGTSFSEGSGSAGLSRRRSRGGHGGG
jgi:seipin